MYAMYAYMSHWRQTADERLLATIPQSNQEPLMVKENVGRLQMSGMSKSVECDSFFPSVL